MALVNVLGTGYTVIKQATLDKQSRYIGMEIITYADATKTVKLAEFRIEAQGSGDSEWEVKSRSIDTPPSDPEEKDTYIVADGGTGAWEGLDGKLVSWNGLRWTEIEGEFQVFIADEEINLIGSNGSWVSDPMQISPNQFDAWFSVEEMSKAGHNLLERCYEYLKTRPEFAHAEDA